MKITITPSGDVSLDVDTLLGNIDVAAEFVNRLRDGNDGTIAELPAAPKKRRARRKTYARWAPTVPAKKAAPDEPVAADLTPALAQVHEYLVDNDRPEGISPADLANIFGIRASAASTRLQTLRKLGRAGTVNRGLWRAV